MNQDHTPAVRRRSLTGLTALAAVIAIPTMWSVTSAGGGGAPQSAPRVAGQSPAIVQAVTTSPAEFVGITPVRVLDTRSTPEITPVGVTTPGPMGPAAKLDVQVTGPAYGIPEEATSVAINVTIDDDATLKSFITVWPTGEAMPLASTNNAEPGFISPNSALIKLGTDGKISVFNQQGAVNVIIDVTGYFVPEDMTVPTTTPDTTAPTSSSPSSSTSTPTGT